MDPETRIREGRSLFREMAGYMRERPLSEYGQDLAPRLVRLREGIAGAELALAQRERRRGNADEARARAEYVLQYFPRTQAAADAAHLLMALDAQ
jgi:outer membrane protein assembly factor BamD